MRTYVRADETEIIRLKGRLTKLRRKQVASRDSHIKRINNLNIKHAASMKVLFEHEEEIIKKIREIEKKDGISGQ